MRVQPRRQPAASGIHGGRVRRSAGLLPYRFVGDTTGADPGRHLLVFIAHMGGPLWARRDDGGWSISKGEYDVATETPRQVARREFREEIGVEAPGEPWLELGDERMRGGKVVTTFAARASESLAYVESNLFEMEWPRGSGRVGRFPEIDRAQWFELDVARRKLVSGQVPFLDRLAAAMRNSPA